MPWPHSFKPQTVLVSTLFLLLISYMLGELMAFAIPRYGWLKYLNPCPFNIKEHAFIVIMSSTGSVAATAGNYVATEDLFYNRQLNGGIAIFMIFSTQVLGYSFAGILREFLVYRRLLEHNVKLAPRPKS